MEGRKPPKVGNMGALPLWSKQKIIEALVSIEGSCKGGFWGQERRLSGAYQYICLRLALYRIDYSKHLQAGTKALWGEIPLARLTMLGPLGVNLIKYH